MKSILKRCVILFFSFNLLIISCAAQEMNNVQYDKIKKRDAVNRLLISSTDYKLHQAILEMNKRKAAIAYNIANASTPGFKPIRFEDEIEAALALYGDDSILNQVHLDDEMIKATQIRLRHSAYVKLLTTKMGITKRVATLGKGG